MQSVNNLCSIHLLFFVCDQAISNRICVWFRRKLSHLSVVANSYALRHLCARINEKNTGTCLLLVKYGIGMTPQRQLIN